MWMLVLRLKKDICKGEASGTFWVNAVRALNVKAKTLQSFFFCFSSTCISNMKSNNNKLISFHYTGYLISSFPSSLKCGGTKVYQIKIWSVNTVILEVASDVRRVFHFKYLRQCHELLIMYLLVPSVINWFL